MVLKPNTKFGPYEILSSLGAGGMGEVYRARDSRLGREVAIKVLPSTLAADFHRLGRFEREARAASALNHPNIVTIYELGEVEATRYIAMELVEGKTLRELLDAGSIPLQKAINIAAQVADGLAKAHDAGIVHRDLKPENLMISIDGFVKILDFGLAKLTAPSSEDSSQVSTIVGYQTRPGLVMGTIGYMSPEQAHGRVADLRSDQFSFGVVLYEMVTGQRAFISSTEAGMIRAILNDDPQPIASLNRDVPAPLCWTVERCLAKEPEKRYDSTRYLAQDLATIRERFSELSQRKYGTAPGNLPVPVTAFVGRDKEVAAVKDLLEREDVLLTTITGPGGVGKTRLSLQVAKELTDHFGAGVYFVPLSTVSEPALIPSLIAQAIGLKETGVEPAVSLKRYLQNLSAPILLVLDNFEHLSAGVQTVAELLVLGAPLKVLATSREPLHIYGEHEFPVPPLTLPDLNALPPWEALSEYSALALFAARAAAVKPDFALTPENAPIVAEICARLDGLPLAIELAAARIKLLSPSAIRQRLASRLQLLTGGARDLPERQQTLRGAIGWSYNLLNEAEQKLFGRLSVFVGGCTLEAVEAVGNTRDDLGLDVLDGIESMVDKSLLRRVESSGGEPRFIMLETIREYALERLAESGEEQLIKRTHAAYYLVLAEEGAGEESDAASAEWLEQLKAESDNVRAALKWLLENGEADWGVRFGAALFRFWESGEHLAEGRDLLDRLLKLGPTSPSQVRARALFAAGALAGEQSDYVAADKFAQESLNISKELGDDRGLAVSLNALAVFARNRGDVGRARALIEESLILWRKTEDQMGLARALSNLANVVKIQGDYATARALFTDCISIFETLGDRSGIAWSFNHLGDIAREQGEVELANDQYEQSLKIFRELGDHWGVANSLADLGNLARDQANFERAQLLYRESLQIFQALEHKRGIARLLECVACSAAAQLDPERSLRLAGAAAALRQAMGAPLTLAEQKKLENSLEPAREALSNGTEKWLEGFGLSVEKAVAEAVPPASQ
jgi:predicted ATPase/serine/threonine protein kinase